MMKLAPVLYEPKDFASSVLTLKDAAEVCRKFANAMIAEAE
jgi:hypothetical protein